MNEEPVYHFVKGQGWVVSDDTVTMKCGSRVRLELRKPEIDEYGSWDDEASTIEAWSEIIKTWSFKYVDTCTNSFLDSGYKYAERHGCDIHWVTIIPVEIAETTT